MLIRKLGLFFCIIVFSCPVFAVVLAGNPKGNVTLVEYFDYQCPHCRKMSGTVDELIKQDPNLRVVYRVVPFLGNTSWFEASAALAAKDQGKFQGFHAVLMEQRQAPSEQDIILLARQVGLDTNKLYSDMHQATVTDQLNDNLKLAQDLNVNGVPTFFIEKTDNPQSSVRYNGEVSYSKLQNGIAKLGGVRSLNQ